MNISDTIEKIKTLDYRNELCWSLLVKKIFSVSLTVLAGRTVQQVEQNLVQSPSLCFPSSQDGWMKRRRGEWGRAWGIQCILPSSSSPLSGALVCLSPLSPIFTLLLFLYVFLLPTCPLFLWCGELGNRGAGALLSGLHLSLRSSTSVLVSISREASRHLVTWHAGGGLFITGCCTFGPLALPGRAAAVPLVVIWHIVRLWIEIKKGS